MTAQPKPAVDPAARAWRDGLYAFVATAVLVAVLVRIDLELPWIGHLGSALISVVFLYVPVYVASARREDLSDYGFRVAPLGKGLAIAGGSLLVIVPLFAIGFVGFYELICRAGPLAQLAPHRMCSHYGGLASLHWPAFALSDAKPAAPEVITGEWCLVQWLVVGLPEELFFRGFLLKKLERRFPPKRRLLGGGIGLALVLSALAFALIHLPREADPRALATFFPGLLFGWMRSATGSILASTVSHGCSNILARMLEISVSR